MSVVQLVYLNGYAAIAEDSDLDGWVEGGFLATTG